MRPARPPSREPATRADRRASSARARGASRPAVSARPAQGGVRRGAPLSGSLAELEPLGAVVERYRLRAQKRLGQHFLLDPQLLARIARAAGDLGGRTVLEVGPGPGGLTRALLATGAGRVIAIERDPRCIAALTELAAAAPGRLEVIEADALRFDIAQLGADHLVAVANLPYNIGTPLLLQWLDRIELFDALILMVQREVAERLAAAPGTAAYGR